MTALEVGSCDDCGLTYDVSDREDHCAECGTCWDHCRADHRYTISWLELANLTHRTQVARFGWCSCEDNEGRPNPFDDCPTTGGGE